MSDKHLYELRMRARLHLWLAEIENLKIRAELAGADLRVAANDKVTELRARHSLACEKIGALGRGGAASWKRRKADADAAAVSLEHTLRTVQARI